jgi:serine/threonine protein kinase
MGTESEGTLQLTLKWDWGWRRDFSERYVVGELLGKGGFGEVHEATEVVTGDSFAVKMMKKDGKGNSEERLDRLRLEVKLLCRHAQSPVFCTFARRGNPGPTSFTACL